MAVAVEMYFDLDADQRVRAIWAALTRHRDLYQDLPLPLSSVGFFATDESAAFLGVTPSPRLLAAHQATVEDLRAIVQGLWPYYDANSLVPHCTLASFVTAFGTIVDVCADAGLPIRASVKSLGVVRVPSGEQLASVDL